MSFFIDTSSLVKIYHKEENSQKVIDLYNSNETIYISELAKIEFISTAYRKYREKEIIREALIVLTDKFQDDVQSRYKVLKFSSLVCDGALDLLQNIGAKYGLRTLDSLQLAFFLTYCEKDDIFVCSDKQFANVVQNKGIKILLPG